MVRLTVHYRYRAMIDLSLSLLSGIALRLRQLIVVFLRANRVSHSKRCQRIVKGAAFSHVSRERRWIGGTRVRACERSPASARVIYEGILLPALTD